MSFHTHLEYNDILICKTTKMNFNQQNKNRFIIEELILVIVCVNGIFLCIFK